MPSAFRFDGCPTRRCTQSVGVHTTSTHNFEMWDTATTSASLVMRGASGVHELVDTIVQELFSTSSPLVSSSSQVCAWFVDTASGLPQVPFLVRYPHRGNCFVLGRATDFHHAFVVRLCALTIHYVSHTSHTIFSYTCLLLSFFFAALQPKGRKHDAPFGL